MHWKGFQKDVFKEPLPDLLQQLGVRHKGISVLKIIL